jgi:hypothetical protein
VAPASGSRVVPSQPAEPVPKRSTFRQGPSDDRGGLTAGRSISAGMS